MLRFLCLAILAVFRLVVTAQADSINVGGLWRTFAVRLPSVYDGGSALPLVIAMHGGFGSGTQLETQSQLTTKAEQEGFIVVYPDGVASNLNIRTWNAGGCCGYAMNNDIDDVGFMNALLDTLQADFAIDTQRIYFTGMSNGGFMTYRVACELSERIAAIAPVSASMTIDVCAPVRPMPVIAFHSYQDESVPYLGGIGTGISAHYNSPLDSVQNAFAAHAGCTVQNDTLLDDAEVTVIRWHGCSCAQEVITYMTHDGGHSWPGGIQMPGGDPVSTAIYANDLMWDFFQEFTLECGTMGVGPDRGRGESMVLSPNPASGIVTVSGVRILRVEVLDIAGSEVLAIGAPRSGAVSVDVAPLVPGVYVVRAKAEDGVWRAARFVRP